MSFLRARKMYDDEFMTLRDQDTGECLIAREFRFSELLAEESTEDRLEEDD